MKQHDLTDIKNEINKVINTPTAEILRSGAIGALGIENPIAGVMAGIGDNIYSNYNVFKLSRLLDGLSTGLNRETGLNELYTYVTSSQENAIAVANLFNKTINAECPKVCCIYGLILADHMNSNLKLPTLKMGFAP